MAGRKKVLWLIKGLNAGGAEKLLSMSLPYLDRDTYDYQVTYLFKNMNNLVPEFTRQGIPVSCLNMERAYDFRVIFKLSRLLREQEIDILHTHLPYSGVMGRLAAILAGVKVIISTEHGLSESYHPITRFLNILTLPLSHSIIAVSQATARSLLRYKIIRQKKVRVIYNAIDLTDPKFFQTDPESIKKSLGINGHSLVVGTVANIRPEKGHQYLIEAAALVLKRRPEVTFVIVGRENTSGDLYRLEELAKRLGIRDKIIFTGYRQDALQIMNIFDVFVLPSIWEAFAIVLLEAMNLGKPIVATNVGGIPEAVNEAVNGFLVAPRQPNQLASRILDLLNNSALRNQMGEAGREKIRDRFNIEHVVKEVEQVYAMALNRGKRIER